MAKFQLSPSFEAYENMLSELQTERTEIAKAAVFEGAKIMADAIRDEIQHLPTYPDEPVYVIHENSDKILKGVNEEQKEGLLTGLGVAQMWNDFGAVCTQIGFNGYNSVKTKKYPKGQPNAMIARSIISGTSVRKRNDFISKAIKKASEKAEEKMAEVIEQKIDEITE